MKRYLFILLPIGCSLHANARDYYISPTGDDQAAGTIEAPFASLVPIHGDIQAIH